MSKRLSRRQFAAVGVGLGCGIGSIYVLKHFYGEQVLQIIPVSVPEPLRKIKNIVPLCMSVPLLLIGIYKKGKMSDFSLGAAIGMGITALANVAVEMMNTSARLGRGQIMRPAYSMQRTAPTGRALKELRRHGKDAPSFRSQLRATQSTVGRSQIGRPEGRTEKVSDRRVIRA